MSAQYTYQTALAEISAGRAKAHPLWVLLSHESDRDGFGLRPSLWEGPGEYQRVSFPDNQLGVLVRLPTLRSRLPIAKAEGRS
jgi:hypothetical protein